MCTPRASASTSSGCAYSRSIRSRTRRNRARSLNRCAGVDVLLTCEIVPRRTGVGQRGLCAVPLRVRSLLRDRFAYGRDDLLGPAIEGDEVWCSAFGREEHEARCAVLEYGSGQFFDPLAG